MAFLPQQYEKIKAQLAVNNTTLVAVSKTKPIEDMMEAYEYGIRDFGENYVQELVEKHAALPKDIRWHFIGHLQRNKVKYIAPFVHLIHGVDSDKLLQEINRQAAKQQRKIDCLLQVYISRDETKFGFDEKELAALMQAFDSSTNDTGQDYFSHVNIKGFMGMATFTEDNDLIRAEFANLKKIYDQYAKQLTNRQHFTVLSMGMSADYQFALENGSTMVRIGSLLFGERNYSKQ